MPEFGISDEKLMDLLGAKGGEGDSGAGDPEKAKKARATSQADKAMKQQKTAMTLQMKQIQLQKQQIQLSMLQKKQSQQGASGGGGGTGGIGGIAAGAALGIILVRSLRAVATNSMILNKSISFINKILGLLVDFILLPFLPLLIDSLINLTNAVIAFGDWWGSIVKEPGNLGTAGKNMASMSAVDIPMLVAQLAGALVGGIVGFLVGGPGGAILGAAIVSVVAGALVSLEYIAGDAFGQIIKDTFYPMGYNFMGWLRDQYETVKVVWESFSTWLGDSLKTLFTNLFAFISGLLEAIPGFKETRAVAKGVSDFAGGKPVGDVVVQISGTVFKDEIDLYNTIVGRLRQELFRWGVGS
jgi:hypothetical protein